MTDQSKQDKTTDSTPPDASVNPEAERAVPESADTTGRPEASVSESPEPSEPPPPDSLEPNSPEPTNSPEPIDSSEPIDSPEPHYSPPPPKATKRRSSSSSGGGFLILLILLLMAGLAALAYYGWQQEQALQARVNQLDEALNEQRDQLSGVQRQAQTAVAEAESKVEQSRRQLSQVQEQLQSNLEEQTRRQSAQIQTLHQQVRSLSTTTTEDWKLAEAYYLTRLASQRLLMERDTGSALALLQAADEIVKNYPDPDLHAVRSALAEDIATLRLANNVDLQGIYLRIAAIGQKAQELPLGEPLEFDSRGGVAEEAEEDTAGAEEETGIWETIRRSFQKALGNLQNYIRITRDDDKLESLMTGPAAAEQLLSSLQLNLDTAQLALLREQPEIYQHSLDRAIQIAARLFNNDQQRERFTAELQSLREVDIVQELPSISASQQAFSGYLERRHRLAPSGNGQQESRSSQP